MKKTLLLFLLACTTLVLNAQTIHLGGVSISLPAPDGYTIITDDMKSVYNLSRQSVEKQNILLGYYISKADAKEALQGKMPSMEKSFIAKTSKQLTDIITGRKAFNEHKKLTREQNRNIQNQIQDESDKIMKRQSKSINKELDVDVALEISQIIPLDPHYETDQAMAYTMYVNYGMKSSGSTEESIVAVTTTLVDIGGKVLFLYCYAPRDEMEWTRKASKTWTENILAKNASLPMPEEGTDPDIKKAARIAAIKQGIIWAVIGAIVGAGYALIQYAKKKKKLSESDKASQ